MESPTDENVTHEPDDAPAELEARFAVSIENLERVREYDDTGSMLLAIQATARLHADRYPDDPEAQGIAAILTAMEHAHRHPEDLEAAAFLAQVGKHDPRPQRSSGLVGHAERYLRKPSRGPRTRAKQADMLYNAVAHGLKSDWSARQIAEQFIMLLRVAPGIAQHTQVPASPGGWRGTDTESEAVSAAENAIETAKKRYGKDAEAITRAVLVALHYPPSKAKNLFTHHDHHDKPKSD